MADPAAPPDVPAALFVEAVGIGDRQTVMLLDESHQVGVPLDVERVVIHCGEARQGRKDQVRDGVWLLLASTRLPANSVPPPVE